MSNIIKLDDFAAKWRPIIKTMARDAERFAVAFGKDWDNLTPAEGRQAAHDVGLSYTRCSVIAQVGREYPEVRVFLNTSLKPGETKYLPASIGSMAEACRMDWPELTSAAKAGLFSDKPPSKRDILRARTVPKRAHTLIETTREATREAQLRMQQAAGACASLNDLLMEHDISTRGFEVALTRAAFTRLLAVYEKLDPGGYQKAIGSVGIVRRIA